MSEARNSKVWADANFAQMMVKKGDLDSFDWSLLQNSVREVCYLFKGTRTEIVELLGLSGEAFSVGEPTRTFMIYNPMVWDEMVGHIRDCLDSLGKEFDTRIELVFGWSDGANQA